LRRRLEAGSMRAFRGGRRVGAWRDGRGLVESNSAPVWSATEGRSFWPSGLGKSL